MSMLGLQMIGRQSDAAAACGLRRYYFICALKLVLTDTRTSEMRNSITFYGSNRSNPAETGWIYPHGRIKVRRLFKFSACFKSLNNKIQPKSAVSAVHADPESLPGT
ncbi:hypothetical protein ILYODFUR_013847 [Ilyodon furcidens]|uniref:Uncharacterized protein n=1 Tax=Ilyodon furcidens TaxID=33524 RepID=A0ABV0VGJ4_9TELE